LFEIVVTNRRLCKGNFLVALEKALMHKPFAVILREKDLTAEAYIALAGKVNRLCERYGVMMIPHTHVVPGIARLHVPFLMATKELAEHFQLSLSIHSVEEARRAEEMGAAFVIAGHIFATQCKAGLTPRGLDFLREVCAGVQLPVFAIGGIDAQNAQDCVDAGAAGVCRMSHWMGL